MNCEIIRDLIPLVVDGAASAESQSEVLSHIAACRDCAEIYHSMSEPMASLDAPPRITKEKAFSLINQRKASVLQALLMLLSFTAITIGVMFESRTPIGEGNGIWALMLIIPATAFMVATANLFFIREYASKKRFCAGSLILTALLAAIFYVWAVGFHYTFTGAETVYAVAGPAVSAVLSVLAYVFSAKYARLLGKE